jgi:hypothetical protein
MQVFEGISFTDDIKEVSNYDGKLVSGVTRYVYRGYHIPTNTWHSKEIYVVGGLEEICHLLNEWNSVMPDKWQYSLSN